MADRARPGFRAAALAGGLLLVLAGGSVSWAGAIPTRGDIESQIRDYRVRPVFDQSYANGSHARQMLDLYLPVQPKVEGPLPVVVFIHGGAWVTGDRKESGLTMARLARTGRYAGVALGYRLATEIRWPAQLHDCKAAIRWLRGHATEFHLDPDRIAVWGTSAGAHLAAMLGVTGDVPELEGELGGFTRLSSRVRCVVSISGPHDLTLAFSPGARGAKDDSGIAGLLETGQADPLSVARSASPLTFVSSGDAPFLLAQGDRDETVPPVHAERMRAALKNASVPCNFVEVRNAGHSFRSPELNQRIRQFLDRNLHDEQIDVSSEPIVLEAGRP